MSYIYIKPDTGEWDYKAFKGAKRYPNPAYYHGLSDQLHFYGMFADVDLQNRSWLFTSIWKDTHHHPTLSIPIPDNHWNDVYVHHMLDTL